MTASFLIEILDVPNNPASSNEAESRTGHVETSVLADVHAALSQCGMNTRLLIYIPANNDLISST
jgi:hypothetical protein